MISVATTLLFILLLFISGKLLECIKQILKLILYIVLKFLDLLGIKVVKAEPRIYVSNQFKTTFKEIHTVKKSKNNLKIKPSLNIPALIILICALSLIVLNLDVVSTNAITSWIYEVLPDTVKTVVGSTENLNIMFTALMFSTVSFSISKILGQWKDTKKYRKAKKDIKMKNYVISNISTKELLDSLKQKDQDIYNSLK